MQQSVHSSIFPTFYRSDLTFFNVHADQDAAIAAAAVLNLVDPSMTGIGGDVFCLYYEAATQKVHALNGSGRSASGATLERTCNALGIDEETRERNPMVAIPTDSIHAVTVPGAAAAWVDIVERWGSGEVSMETVLAPAVKMAEEGVAVSEISSYSVSILGYSPGFFGGFFFSPSLVCCKEVLDKWLITSG